MEKVRLGRSDLRVSPLCFGGNVFGWTLDKTASFQMLDRIHAAGINFVDTSDAYSRWVPGNEGGESEAIIGEWMSERRLRDQMIVSTKVGLDMGPGTGGLSKAYIMSAVEASLRRLRTDFIDLYLSHGDLPATPQAETLEAYEQLIRQGKVRAVGASNFSAARLAEARHIADRDGFAGYAVIEPGYNLYDRQVYETEIEPVAVNQDLGVMSYFALAAGFLSGKYRDAADLAGNPRGQRMIAQYMNDRGVKILKGLDLASDRLGHSAATIALAWAMRRKSITAPIASATSAAQFAELEAATRLVLDDDTLAVLDVASLF